MMEHGYVKLYRKSLTSGLMQNPELWLFWCWCLLKASHCERKAVVGFQEITLQPGQFIFGRKAAAKELPLSERKIRTSVHFLVESQKMTIKTTNKFSIISIVNWNTYQIERPTTDQQDDQQTTNKRPTTDHKQECKALKHLKNNTLSGEPDPAPLKSPKNQSIPFDEIIDRLNQKTGKGFRSDSKNTKNYIKARWNQGFSLTDFFTVIDKKVVKWGADPKMVDYLRPETLFGHKFESYLNESGEPVSSSNGMREFRADDPYLNENPERN